MLPDVFSSEKPSYEPSELASATALAGDLVVRGPAIDLLELVLAGLKPQSRAGYTRDLAAFARFGGGGGAGDAVAALVAFDRNQAAQVVMSYQAQLEGQGLAVATVNRRIAAILRALKRCRMAGLTTVSIEVDRRKAEVLRDTTGPGRAGWERMFRYASSRADGGSAAAIRDRAILLLLHDRALRRGELAGLDYPEDFEPGRGVQVLGKGRSSKEWLTVSARALTATAAWVAVRGDWPGPLFVRLDRAAGNGRGRLSGKAVNEIVGALAEGAKLGRPVRAHGLRHQAITEALDSGWDVRDVKQFSRHRNIDTVLVYDDRRRDIGGQISTAIGGEKRRRPRGSQAAGN